MKASKKCPTCGHWSTWNHEPTNRCDHCQQLLDPAAFNRVLAQNERKEEEQKRFKVSLIKINPQERFLIRFIKRIGLGFQIAFVAFVTFFLWLIALLAG